MEHHFLFLNLFDFSFKIIKIERERIAQIVIFLRVLFYLCIIPVFILHLTTKRVQKCKCRQIILKEIFI
jgi:hypothetical protein